MAMFGIEYSRKSYEKGWGDNLSDFTIKNMISDHNSNLYNDSSLTYINDSNTDKYNGGHDNNNAIFVGDGWYTNTYSLTGEANFEFHSLFNLLLSGRIDKNTYSKFLYSPRVAIISNINDRNVLKFIIQQSVRMNTAYVLKKQDHEGTESEPEKFRGVEIIWDTVPLKNLLISSSIFYNQIESIGWSTTQKRATLLGNLQIFGGEIEAKYKMKNSTIGLNHSYVKLYNWKLADGETKSGISYSDYYKDGMTGYGNDLNNWSNNVTKFYANYIYDNFIFHIDSRLYWGFQGAEDGLSVIENAADGTANEDEIDETINDIKEKDVYGFDWRLNMSLSYSFADLTITSYAMNINSIFKESKRFSYDPGVHDITPHRTAFVVEPFTLGIKVSYVF